MNTRALLPTTYFLTLMMLTSCSAKKNPTEELKPTDAVYIAPNGDDANSGTIDKPFATLERARDAIRELKDEAKGGAVVRLRGGIYERREPFVLGPQDSGRPEAPVVYEAADGEKVTIFGGKLLPADAFKPARREFVERLAEAPAQRHILELDLKALGITDYGKLQEQHVVDFGSSSGYRPSPMELFIDGRPMNLARWPNLDPDRPLNSLIQTGKQIFTEDKEKNLKFCGELQFKDVPSVNKDADDVGRDPQLASERINRWKDISHIPDGYVAGGIMRGYAYTTRRITGLDLDKRSIKFSNPLPFGIDDKQEVVGNFFFRNIPQELDEPGEYYIDREKGVLYLYPPNGFSKKSQVAVSMMEDVLVAMDGVSHTRLKGLTLEGTRGTAVYIANGDDNIITQCEIRNIGMLGVQIGMGYDPKNRVLIPRIPGSLRHALCTGMEKVSIADLETWGHPRGGTALDVKGGKGNGVEKCRIYDTGAGGVILGGGDRKTLTPAGNFVRDSELFRTDRLSLCYAEAILVHGDGNLVIGNYLHDAQGGLIYIHGNDHLIEFNELTRAPLTSRDCGVIEIRQNPSQLGNRINHNFLHDIGRKGYNPQAQCIYLDNESNGVELFGNVFARIHTRSVEPYTKQVVCVNGGYGHSVINNIFVDSTGVTIPDGNDMDKAKKIFDARKFMMDRDVSVLAEPYVTRYPEFAKRYQGIMAGDANTKLYNVAFNNVFLGNGSDIGPGRYPDEPFRRNNLTIQYGEDIGFVDEATDNFNLRPDSLVYKRLPDFKPIPFDKMRQAQKWPGAVTQNKPSE